MVCDDLDEALFLFDLRGYVVLPGVLAPEEVAELNRLMDARHLPPPGPSLDSQIFSGFLAWGEPFVRLLDHPRVFRLLEELVGPRLRLDRCYGIRMRTGTDGLPLHGGNLEIEDGTEYYEFRRGRMANGVTTVSWALCDAAPGDGGLGCIPGSHKSNLPRPADLDVTSPLVEQVPLRAGDVVVFTGAIAHGTKPWHAPHERRCLLFKYAPGHIAWSSGYLDGGAEPLQGLTERQAALFDPPQGHRHDPDGSDVAPRPRFMDPGAGRPVRPR